MSLRGGTTKQSLPAAAPNQIASLTFAMTLQEQHHRTRIVSLRGGTTKQSLPAAAPNQIASLAFATTPQGQRHRPRTVSLRGGTTKQSRPSAAPTPDCFTSVRNDTSKTTNQIASLMFAMTPQGPRHRTRIVSLRGGTTKQSQACAGRWVANRLICWRARRKVGCVLANRVWYSRFARK